MRTLKVDRILVAFDQFLTPDDLDFVRKYAMKMEYQFSVATTVQMGRPGTLDLSRRRARVLPDAETGEVGRFFRARIEQMLPSVLGDLQLPIRPSRRVSVQVTATGDSEFYKPHTDNSPHAANRRELSFVYFCNPYPLSFQGGELRIYDTDIYARIKDPNVRPYVILPEQNRIVFFQSDFVHEICPVVCPSNRLLDARLTVNGWIYFE